MTLHTRLSILRLLLRTPALAPVEAILLRLKGVGILLPMAPALGSGLARFFMAR